MDLREKLRGRSDVPDDQVDDVIELAAQLQEEARQPAERGASVAEVQAVAAELAAAIAEEGFESLKAPIIPMIVPSSPSNVAIFAMAWSELVRF